MMMKLKQPPLLIEGDVTIRVIERRDAKGMQQLLQHNRAWLTPWEATLPGARLEEPGTVPLGPAIRQMLRRMKNGHSVPFVVLYRDELVGQLSISDISWGAVCSGQIGYWISEAYAGKGITPTAVSLAMNYAFTFMGLHRIEICMRPENVASQRVVKKLSLRYEGHRERYIYIDGDWRDHDCFAMTSEEFSPI